MGRLIGQLACGRCQERFWPERDAVASVIVLCPHCGAGHGNPEALPFRQPDSAYIPAHGRRVREWALRHWADQLPRVGWSSPFAATASTAGALDGFHYSASRAPISSTAGTGAAAGQCTFVLVAALPPASRPTLPAGWRWARGGVWAHYPRPIDGDELLQSILPTLLVSLRAVGAQPLHTLEEVDDPTPLDPAAHERELAVTPSPEADAALESHAIRCSGCGAPTTAAALVGGRCPYCGAPQALAPELEEALRQYRRRVHAAQLTASSDSLLDRLFGPLPPPPQPGAVAMACVHCGAPNQHRPGALDERCRSCGAGLVPSDVARARGLALSAEAAREGRRQQVAAHQDRMLAQDRTVAAFGIVQLGFFALSVAVSAAVMIGMGLFAIIEGRPQGFIAVGINGGFVVGLAAVGIHVYRKRKRAIATWRPRLWAVAQQLGATALGGSGELRRWAQTWWDDRLSPSWLKDEPQRGVFTTHVAGFPVAVTAAVEVIGAPGLMMGTRLRSHAVVLVAAAFPRDVAYWAKTGSAAKIRDELERADFHLELRAGGLALQAGGSAIARMRAEPDRVAALAPVVFRLTQLAHHLRAEAPT